MVGESVNFPGALDWLRDNGVAVVDLASAECVRMLAGYIAAHPAVWNEDIGEPDNLNGRTLRSAPPD